MTSHAPVPSEGSASYSLPREPLSKGEIHNPKRMPKHIKDLKKATLGRPYPFFDTAGFDDPKGDRVRRARPSGG